LLEIKQTYNDYKAYLIEKNEWANPSERLLWFEPFRNTKFITVYLPRIGFKKFLADHPEESLRLQELADEYEAWLSKFLHSPSKELTDSTDFESGDDIRESGEDYELDGFVVPDDFEEISESENAESTTATETESEDDNKVDAEFFAKASAAQEDDDLLLHSSGADADDEFSPPIAKTVHGFKVHSSVASNDISVPDADGSPTFTSPQNATTGDKFSFSQWRESQGISSTESDSDVVDRSRLKRGRQKTFNTDRDEDGDSDATITSARKSRSRAKATTAGFLISDDDR
jgi:hypothetical protein